MGEGKRIRQRIESLQSMIDLHLEKITGEYERPMPDIGLVDHWNREIEGWRKSIAKLEKRLERRRRRGR